MTFLKKMRTHYQVTAEGIDRWETLKKIKELVSDLKADCYHLQTGPFETIEHELKAIEQQMEKD